MGSLYTAAMYDSVPLLGPKATLFEPRVTETGKPIGREKVRTPVRFRGRVIAQFRSPQNLAYLRHLFESRVPRGPLRDYALSTLHDAALSFSEGEGRALEVLQSDPVAQRGRGRPALGLWDEVRRLNRVFYEDRLASLRDQASMLDRRAPRDGISEDEEPYHIRMFVADSLRPPGLEHLNTPGPLYALREDSSTWAPRPAGRSEAFAASPSRGEAEVYPYGEADAPWEAGSPNRTPEQALAEYWGDGWTASETQIGGPETMGLSHGSLYAWGNSWQDNGGTRFMRRESPPFWQKGGREGIDYDIEETLGTQARELDNHVRRWNTERVRHPRGQEYRSYGPRSGHVV